MVSLEQSKKLLDQQLNSINNIVDNISKSPQHSPDQVNTLNNIIETLKQNLANVEAEKSIYMNETKDINPSAKTAMLNEQGTKLLKMLMNTRETLVQTTKKLQQDQLSVAEQVNRQRNILEQNRMRFSDYSKDIEQKMEILATRDRMLQLSQERNAYKKKVIYVLLSVIIALLVSIVSAYVYFGKKS